MNIKALMLSMVILTMIGGGLTVFFTSTAQTYGVDIGQASQLNETYNQYSMIYNETGSIYALISGINTANALSWLNVFPIVIGVFKIMVIDTPMAASSIITDTVNLNTGLFIPNWLVFGVGAIIIIIITWEILSYLLSGTGSNT